MPTQECPCTDSDVSGTFFFLQRFRFKVFQANLGYFYVLKCVPAQECPRTDSDVRESFFEKILRMSIGSFAVFGAITVFMDSRVRSARVPIAMYVYIGILCPSVIKDGVVLNGLLRFTLYIFVDSVRPFLRLGFNALTFRNPDPDC